MNKAPIIKKIYINTVKMLIKKCIYLPLVFFVITIWVVAIAQESPSPNELIIEGIKCEGNQSTDCKIITNELYLKDGDKIDEEELNNAKIRIALLGLFKNVEVKLEKGSKKGNAIVVFLVEEDSPIVKEFGTGTAIDNNWVHQYADVKYGTRNFLGKNKILSLSASGNYAIANADNKAFKLNLNYADPKFLGSQKYYLTSGAAYSNSYSHYYEKIYSKSNYASVFSEVGRRFADFSYISLGYVHRFIFESYFSYDSRMFDSFLNRDGIFTQYGWNSENDAYFPTSGSQFGFLLGYGRNKRSMSFEGNMAFRKTWTLNDKNSLMFNFGSIDSLRENKKYNNRRDDIIIALQYNYDWKKNVWNDEVKTGRFFVAAGTDYLGLGSYSPLIAAPGLKVGTRLSTKTYGIVNLSFTYKTEVK